MIREEANKLHHSKLVTPPEMIEAGRDAFLRWFRQPHLEDCLPSLPESADISALASAIFLSMMRRKPVS